MRCWRSVVVESPYSGGGILGTVIQDFTGGITNGSAIVVERYGAIEVVGKGSNAL